MNIDGPFASGAAYIDGRIMGNDQPGPVSTAIRDACWSRRAADWHATPVDYGFPRK